MTREKKENVRSILKLAVLIALALTLPSYALAEGDAENAASEAASPLQMFTKGIFSGNVRTIYFASHNNYFSGIDQDTASYGGNLYYRTAKLKGFSLGVSGFLQRGIAHSSNPSKVDGYLGPNLLGLGEAYADWEKDGFRITAGNQKLGVPFAASDDWRMVPPLYQGVTASYGDGTNFLTASRIFRFKSYIDNSYKEQTTYNSGFDPFSGLGSQETDGFWSIGGGGGTTLAPVTLKAQGWYVNYLDYARMTYLEGQVMRREGAIKPFAGAQFFYEANDGKRLLGNVRSEVYGLQLGVKRNSVTAALGYDHVTPHADSYLNGALVTPYSHNVSSGPLFAQPLLNSTQDLGAGNAYAVDISGAPSDNLFLGGRYSFMDLKPSQSAPSWDQSEYMVFGIYKLPGRLKGFSIANFFALQTSPVEEESFWQNRLTLEYAF